MSDCSTQMMKPEKQQRTCENCSERYFAPKCNRIGWTDFDEAAIPDDDGKTFADYCVYWKHSDVQDLEQRCESLARVAQEMYSTLCLSIELLSMVRIPRQNGKTYMGLGIRDCAIRRESYRDRLEELGVSVDGQQADA